MLFGDPKLGKSVLVQQLGFALVTGLPWVGLPTQPTSVLYVQAEIHPTLFRDRMMKMWNLGFNIPHQREYFTSTAIPAPKLDTEAGLKELSIGIQKYRPGVVIIDPIYRFATLDMEHLQRTVENIDRLIYAYNITVVMVHHPRKTQSDASGNSINRGGEELWGARILEWYFDSILYLQGDVKEDTRLLTFTLRNSTTMGYFKTLEFDRSRLIFNAI